MSKKVSRMTIGGRDGEHSESALRRSVLDAALAMSRRGLSPGRSGNISSRFADGMLITPSGMAYEGLEPSDIVFVGRDGGLRPGERKPSSEWRFHLDVYGARTNVGGIVHTHSMHATVLACAHLSIPAFHYMVAAVGGKEIPVVPYATFGTAELSRHVVKGLAKGNACLMANHGQIAVAGTCEQALELAAEVEVLAEQYWKLLAVAEPKLLPDDEMKRVLAHFKGYGQNAQKPMGETASPNDGQRSPPAKRISS